ncbi:SNARE-associated protein Snapin [Pithys albifrons albifrons]|uniref:SNARE-associated protein Snapin n=1 Tax=Pithys albifrons albifrons TaxID=3385563 RepID=UPI003A5CDBB4
MNTRGVHRKWPIPWTPCLGLADSVSHQTPRPAPEVAVPANSVPGPVDSVSHQPTRPPPEVAVPVASVPLDYISREPPRPVPEVRPGMAASGGPAARELFAEGLLQFLRPAVRQLDRNVHSVRESQVELREHIDSLAQELCRINEDQKVGLDLDPYVKKLLNARRRVVLVNNILQNAQERLRRLNHSVAKETVRRRALLESGGCQGK